MNELGIALIAAGAAIAGSGVTGWYARGAGIRQAEAARHAGDRQADALLESVRSTLHKEARSRMLDVRRHAYVQFLGAADARILTERTGRGHADGDALLERALGAVILEGPADVAEMAEDVVGRLRRHAALDELNHAKREFVSAAQRALNEQL